MHSEYCSRYAGEMLERTLQPPATRDEIARDFRLTPIEPSAKYANWSASAFGTYFPTTMKSSTPTNGSWTLVRFATGGFIADYVNRCSWLAEYDYIDFYLGTIWIAQRADLTPVYRMLFRRLMQDLTWIGSITFPNCS